jgi:hypothetical protein
MNNIKLNLTYNYLQEIRLAHAIMETDFNFYVEPEWDIRLQRLKEHFGVNYCITNDNDKVFEISDVLIAHRTIVPETKIGNISRPLILPHAMFDYCKSLWPKERKIKFAFIGKLTKERQVWMQGFLSKKIKGYYNITGKVNRDYKIFSFLNNIFKFSEPVLMTASLRGRQFPGKSWDDDYFQLQAQSKFIICPSGDVGCPWTYRFFEAMICGAIPIVESTSPCYAPYKFYMADEDPKNFIYDTEMVKYNFEECVKHLTVPIDELTNEIKSLIISEN